MSDEHPEQDLSNDNGVTDQVQRLEAEIEALRGQLEEVSGRLEEREAALRAVSKHYTELKDEMATFRERMEAQADARLERKAAEVVEKFFEPVQNLKRSLQVETEDAHAVRDGVRMIAEQFSQAMTGLGLQEIPGEGAPFDPHMHEAIAVNQVDDPELDGKVVEVHSSGYKVGHKVLKPARVIIGQMSETSEN